MGASIRVFTAFIQRNNFEMFTILKIKKLLSSGLLLTLFYCIICCADSVDVKTTNLETLKAEIEKKIEDYKQTREKIHSKFPSRLLTKFEMKERIYAMFGDFFRDPKKYNSFSRSLTKDQHKEFRSFRELFGKKILYKAFSASEIVQMMKILKADFPDGKNISALTRLYTMFTVKPSGSDINKCKELQKKLNITEDFIDYLKCTRFQDLYQFYYAIIRTENYPLRMKKREITRLLNKLLQSSKNDGNRDVQKEMDSYYRNSLKVFGETPQRRAMAFRYYYCLKLFSDSVQDPQKSKTIKKVLQESKLMRKAVLSLLIAGPWCNRHMTHYVKKYDQKLDYNNFDKYWPVLQEMSKTLIQEVFRRMKKEYLEKCPVAVRKDSELAGQCFIECFFGISFEPNN